MTDQALTILVTEAKQGKAEAFRGLFDLLEPQLYAFVRYRVRDHEAAQDLVQDTLIGLFRALADFTVHSTGQFYQYVYTIARRQLAQYYDSKHTKGEQHRDVGDESLWIAPETDTSAAGDVARALATLDAVTRDIVVFHHWSRYTFVEIAEILGMEEGAVRTRHHRAKAELAALLA